jgi:PhnB protein
MPTKKASSGRSAKKGAAKRASKKPAAKARKAKPVPDGYTTVTAHLVLDDCAGAIEFYKKAFGAKERMRMPGPGGKIVHAELQVGSSRIMVNDEMPPMPNQPGVFKSPKAAGAATSALFLYVPNVDKVFERAVQAGCTVRMPPTDMFWGDRFGQVMDPYGHGWGMATHTEDMTPKQMAKRQQEFFAKMQQGGGPPA